MNIISTELRNRLSVPRLGNLMFVSLVGPAPQEFQPLSYVKQWLLGGHRAACDNQSKKYVHETQDDSRYRHMWDVFKYDFKIGLKQYCAIVLHLFLVKYLFKNG